MPALQAARTLAARFHPCGHFLQAWGPVGVQDERAGRSIIDTMMNLDLLFWASRHSGDPSFAQIAAAHARTAQAFLVRADGSTAHVADFDPETGRFLGQATHQGLSGISCWSRGQACTVYGFSRCHHATGEPAFLETAQKAAEYALSRGPADRVPYWDYASPDIPNDVRDSSAAAILAGGLLALAEEEALPERRAHWRGEAAAILESLWQNYSSRGSVEPSILIHGTRSRPHGLADHGLIYGDYYFVEALLKLTEAGASGTQIPGAPVQT
jgi:unsaturated chondroitin disaccharide hydrolase